MASSSKSNVYRPIFAVPMIRNPHRTQIQGIDPQTMHAIQNIPDILHMWVLTLRDSFEVTLCSRASEAWQNRTQVVDACQQQLLERSSRMETSKLCRLYQLSSCHYICRKPGPTKCVKQWPFKLLLVALGYSFTYF